MPSRYAIHDNLSENLRDMVEEGMDLAELSRAAEKIKEIVKTGSLE